MSNDVVISKELRDNLLKWDRYEDWMALRTAPETVSLEGADFIHILWMAYKWNTPYGKDEDDHKKDFHSWLRVNYPNLVSDLHRLVAKPELSLFQREQIAREFVEAFPDAIAPTKWAYEQVCAANEAKSVELKTLKRLVPPVQPSAVVSREDVRRRLASQHGWLTSRQIAEIADSMTALQLPQPVAPVQSGGVEEAIKILEHMLEVGDWTVHAVKLIKEALHHLTTTQIAPSVSQDEGWISVKDRLPGVCKYALCVDEEGNQTVAQVRENVFGNINPGYQKYWHIFGNENDPVFGKVTHWRRLPPSPADKGEQ